MSNNPILDQLRDIAIRFNVQPKASIGHAAKLDTIIKVLTEIKKSYENFLAIELLKNKDFKRVSEGDSTLLKLLINNLELIAVDVDFGSFEIALAPDIIQGNQLFFSDFTKELKANSFSSYKELIQGDYRDFNYMRRIEKRYSEEERLRIYRPIFSLVQNDFKVNIKDNKGKVVRTIFKPSKEKQRFYLPKIAKLAEGEHPNRTILAYVDVGGTDGDIKLDKKHIKKVHHIEELEHDTYPFTPTEIVYENFIVEFHNKLICTVSYEDDLYFITNDELDLTAWGETREEAEEAFRFSLYSVYKNFYGEEEERLSEEAKVLKELLFRITKKINL